MEPAHRAYPELHEKLQLPLEQLGVALLGALQALPHPPQWLVLVDVLTHEEPHLVYPELQVKPQLPLVHFAVALAGALQTLPQPPQWLTSVEVLTQAPLHSVPLHVDMQLP